MKLVTISPYVITIKKVWNYQIALMIKRQVFVKKDLPVQTQQNRH